MVWGVVFRGGGPKIRPPDPRFKHLVWTVLYVIIICYLGVENKETMSNDSVNIGVGNKNQVELEVRLGNIQDMFMIKIFSSFVFSEALTPSPPVFLKRKRKELEVLIYSP